MTLPRSLPRSLPDAQGVSPAAVTAFLEAVARRGLELHSFMLVRRGRVVAEQWWSPYSPDRPHRLNSLSKSFTSTAIGLLVHAGELSVADPVVSFFPDDLPGVVGDHLAAMTVGDLLTMRTGHAQDVTDAFFASDAPWTRVFLAQPVEFAPGTHFVYNSGATYMLSAIVQKLAGETLLDFLGPRLFKPLGIDDASWLESPEGVSVGGWGLALKTEDVAKFGQLYLQRGRWNGAPVLPEAWVGEATAAHVPPGPEETNDWNRGYGYQFWRCRHGAYRGDGAFGQFCVVMPGHDAVVAITAHAEVMQDVLDLVWAHLLPGLGAAPEPRHVPETTFAFEDNALGLNRATLEVRDTAVLRVGDEEVRAGFERWIEGETTLGEQNPEPVLGLASWIEAGTLALKFVYVRAGYGYVVTLDEDVLRVELPRTLGAKGGTLVGRRVR